MRGERAAWGVLLVGAALLLVARAGSVPLLDPDEARFARTSVEMLRGGDLVVPRFEGEARLHKPPLVHWIQAAVFHLAGTGELAARAHSIVASVGSLLLVGFIARRRFGEEAGAWAAAILGTMPLFLVAGRLGTTDALLAVHVLAVVALDLAAPRGGTTRTLAVGGLLGLGFMVKGPVGTLLPLLLLLAGRTAAGLEVLPTLTGLFRGLAAWCAVVLPWSLALVRRVGVDAAVAVVRGEALERYFGGTVHIEPAWYYLPVAAVAVFPWTGPLVVGLGRVIAERRDESSRTAVWCAAGLVAGLAFFSLGKGKLPTYLLPLLPFAALVVTWELGRELAAPERRTAGPALVAGTLGATAALLGAAALRWLDGPPRTAAWIGAVALALGALAAGHGTVLRRPRQVYAAAAAASATFLFTCVVVLFPWVGERRSAGGLVERVPDLATAERLAAVEMEVPPSLTFYLERTGEVVALGELERWLAAAPEALLVFDADDLASLPRAARAGLREVGRSGKYRVFRYRGSGVAGPPPSLDPASSRR